MASRIGESRSQEALPRGTGTAASTVLRHKRMSFKAAGQATLSFLSARRRLEDGLKCFSKRRPMRRESLCGDSTYIQRIVPRGFVCDLSKLNTRSLTAAATFIHTRSLSALVIRPSSMKFDK